MSINQKGANTMIYIVVNVTYDYYRFQRNLGAFTNLQKACDCAMEFAKSKQLTTLTGWESADGFTYPLLQITKDQLESEAFNEMEENHIWIQIFSGE
jgi:hypothetical protein